MISKENVKKKKEESRRNQGLGHNNEVNILRIYSTYSMYSTYPLEPVEDRPKSLPSFSLNYSISLILEAILLDKVSLFLFHFLQVFWPLSVTDRTFQCPLRSKEFWNKCLWLLLQCNPPYRSRKRIQKE